MPNDKKDARQLIDDLFVSMTKVRQYGHTVTVATDTSDGQEYQVVFPANRRTDK